MNIQEEQDKADFLDATGNPDYKPRRWRVDVPATIRINVEIEADSERHAIAKGLDLMFKFDLTCENQTAVIDDCLTHECIYDRREFHGVINHIRAEEI